MRKAELGVITGLFPNARYPQDGAFVQLLLQQFVDAGRSVSVVYPGQIGRGRSLQLPAEPLSEACHGLTAIVSPLYPSFSNARLMSLSAFRLSCWSFTRAALRGARGLARCPEIMYGHFLYPAGAAALAVAERIGIPAVVALGESDLEDYDIHLERSKIQQTLGRFAGILTVSMRNRDYCVSQLAAKPERILVLPNAPGPEFRPSAKEDARRRLGLSKNQRLVVFVGHLEQRKGPLRLLRAIERLPNLSVAFLGTGPQSPGGCRVLFCGSVSHDAVPTWLNAADVFALPTASEGCPNAVVEAMACGLPVLTSDTPEMRELIADGVNGMLINPHDVEQIAAGLHRLLTDRSLRRRISSGALRRMRNCTIEARAKKVGRWLDDLSQLHQSGQLCAG